MQFQARSEARVYLRRLGMVLLIRGTDREYWGFTDRKNVLLDHSATITRTGKTFHVSNFAR